MALAALVALPLPAGAQEGNPTGGSVPPSEDDVEVVVKNMTEALDGLIYDYDPTGELPTPTALQARGVVDALEAKLEAFQELLSAGQIEQVPMDSVDFENMTMAEGFLPNKTFFGNVSLLDLGLNLDLSGLLQKPSACLQATPTVGVRGTTFALSGACSTDIQTAARDLEVRWDYEDDGLWDTGWSTAKTANVQYSTTGTKRIRLEVRDEEANTEQTTQSVLVHDPPNACFNYSPASGGTTDTTYGFDASCSTDDFTGQASLEVRWDWTSDGVPDTSWSTQKTAAHQFTSPGSWNTTLEVRDQHGLVGSTSHTFYVAMGAGGGGGGGGGGGVGAPSGDGVGDPNVAETNTGGGGDSPGGDTVQYNGIRPLIPGQSVRDLLERWFDLVVPERWSLRATTLEGAPDSPITQALAVGSAPHVRFQRVSGGPYEPATEAEVRYVEGASLGLAPLGLVPQEALVEVEWLRSGFGTFGSTEAFHTRVHEGTLYAVLHDPNVLTGLETAFSAIVLGQSGLYTLGHPDIVEIRNWSAIVALVEQPGTVTLKHVWSNGNGTSGFFRNEPRGRLALAFEAASWQDTEVVVNETWILDQGLREPLFHTNTGARVSSDPVNASYRLRLAENGSLVVRDASLGPYYAEVGGSHGLAFEDESTERLWLLSDRRDPRDNLLVRPLPYPFEPTQDFNVSASWRVARQGNWQSAYPLVLTRGVVNGSVRDSPATAYVEYVSNDANQNQQPEYVLRFRDANGTLRIDQRAAAPVGGKYNLTVAYDADAGNLSLQVTDGLGGVVAQAWALLGDDAVASLSFDELGIATDGANGTLEPGVWGWVENLGFSPAVSASASSVSFSEDFDDGVANGWTLTGEWRVGNSCFGAYSSPYHLSYHRSSACDYNTGATNSGTATFAYNLGGVSGAGISFKHLWETESYSSPYDVQRVEISTNAGGSWTTLRQWDSRNANQLSWLHESINLDAYVGAAVQIRFSFNTLDSLYNTYRGWYIDNVELTTTGGGNFLPTPCFTITPTVGTSNTNYYFDGGCSTDVETATTALQFRWDWDNNGWNTGWSTTYRTISQTFSTPGTHTVKMEVMDDAGSAQATTRTLTTDNPPNACFVVSPWSGTTATIFEANANCSTDDLTSLNDMRVRWNFGDDASWEVDAWTQAKTATHTFSSPGTYPIRLQIRDSRWQVSDRVEYVSVSAATLQTGLTQGFESGFNGWSGTGLWHLTTTNQVSGSWAVHYGYQCNPNYSGCRTNYDTPGTANSGTLTSPTFIVPSQNPFLIFDTWYQTEGGGCSNPDAVNSCWDAMTIRIVTGQGTQTLDWVNGKGLMQSWFKKNVDLKPYVGQSVAIQFRFDTKDHILNDFQGWYLDNIEVKSSEFGVTVSTTPWSKSSVQGNSWTKANYTDYGFDTSVAANDPSDYALTYFDVQKSQFQEHDKVYLAVWASATGCNGQTTATHGFYVNGNLRLVFNACKWPSYYEWGWFDIPQSILVNGVNDFKIQPLCNPCDRALVHPVDTTDPSGFTDIYQNGVRVTGDLSWTLYMYRSQAYDTLERIITYTIREPGLPVRKEYETEAYVYYDPAQLDTLAVRILKDEAGNNKKLSWSSTRYAGNTIGAWQQGGLQQWLLKMIDICYANPNQKQAPPSNQRHTAFVHEEETRRWVNGQPQGRIWDRFLFHVPSSPSTLYDQQSYNNKQRNPPAFGSYDDGNGYWYLLKGTHFLQTCATSNAHGGSHPHQHYQLAVHAFDVDSRPGWDEAVQIAQGISNWAENRMKAKGIDISVRYNNAMAARGFITSWLFAVVQTGDIVSVNLNEFDFCLTQQSCDPFSRLQTIPSFTPLDPWLPGHLLPDNKNFLAEERYWP